ncbi:uncharacterized protein LOC132199380 isoform X3 [Neocloeon triangulifer]|uniref:uncharacterized protein LOC132199380 isoform X3 n=1 Tax=Neocloeon triangulifer TaxID=2078957 RepID=UPI00286EF37B|nr:uncharacterized protein LOC132199380 isoform X3 [Neocloeon triangulifer]
MAETSHSEIGSTIMDNRSHLETPPPSPPINEHQTEARIEYTDAATLRLPVNRGSKRRPASSDLENHTDHTVPPVEFKEPSDLITKAPCRQHSNHDEIELESWNWDQVSCGTGIFMWEREWEFYIPQEENQNFDFSVETVNFSTLISFLR